MGTANALLDSRHIPLRRFGAALPLDTFEAELDLKWPGMIPASFLFDGPGPLRYFWMGEVDERELPQAPGNYFAPLKTQNAFEPSPLLEPARLTDLNKLKACASSTLVRFICQS